MPFVAAADADTMLWGGYEGNVQQSSGLGNTDPRETAGSVVNIALGFLGIIFLLLIIFGLVLGGSGGSEERAEAAKKTIIAGVVGLIIVLASYGISQFVIARLYSATGASG